MVRVAAVALNVRTAEPAFNSQLIRDSINEHDAELWVGSELALSGRWCQDLFKQSLLTDACWSEMLGLLPLSLRCCILVGMPVRDDEKVYMAQVILQAGEIQGMLVRDPEDADEHRWFDACHVASVTVNSQEIPVLSGGFVLNPQGNLGLGLHWDRSPLQVDYPQVTLARGQLSVGDLGCEGDHRWVMPGRVMICHFDGKVTSSELCSLQPWSACVQEMGPLRYIYQANVDTKKGSVPVCALVDGIILWLRDRARSANAHGFQLALSGGIDSGCVALLIAELIQRDASFSLQTVYLPGQGSTAESEERASRLATCLSSKHRVISMLPVLRAVDTALGDMPRTAKGNVAARMRMVLTYAMAQQNASLLLVVGSANADEGRMGYFTKWDASAADLNPLASLSKQCIRGIVAHLARGRAEVESLLTATPSAELWPGQSDEQEMGITYAQLERLGELHHLGPTAMIERGEDPELVCRYWQRWWQNLHKAEAIPAALHLNAVYYYPS